MEEFQNENNTNLTSNKDTNESLSITTKDNMRIEDGINSINESSDLLAQKISEYKPEEITLNKKLIIDSITLYNTISTNYGEKKIDITRLAQDQQEKALLETELLLLNGKKISHIDALDKCFIFSIFDILLKLKFKTCKLIKLSRPLISVI